MKETKQFYYIYNYGLLKDTPENRKELPKKIIKKPCTICEKLMNTVKETNIMDSNSLCVSGCPPPKGFITKSTYYSAPTCNKCYKNMEDYYD